MNEEMMTMNQENEDVEAMTTTEATENSGGGILGKVILGLVGVGAAAAGVLYLTRTKREQAQIKRLEKKGYVVHKPIDIPESKVVEVEATEEAE